VLPQLISNEKHDRVTNQYHNPLAVEPESGKGCRRKIMPQIFLGAASVNATARAEQ